MSDGILLEDSPEQKFNAKTSPAVRPFVKQLTMGHSAIESK
jgi:hypothetical protein